MKTLKWLILSSLIFGFGTVFAEYGDSCIKDCQCDVDEWCDMTGSERWSGWGSCVRGENPDCESITCSEPGSCRCGCRHEPSVKTYSYQEIDDDLITTNL